MINWNKLQIKIDAQAEQHLNAYFKELEKILDDQNLTYKKKEVFNDLENHIIDYITENKNLKEITVDQALDIITELGSPDEFADYSNIPSLVDEINSKDQIKGKQNYQTPNKYILCENCNEKIEINSVFCINCGVKINNSLETEIKYYQGSGLEYILKNHPVFFLNMMILYIFAFSGIFGPYSQFGEFNYILSFLKEAWIITEILFIPMIAIYQIQKQSNNYFSIFVMLLSIIVKFVIVLSPIIILVITDIVFHLTSPIGQFTIPASILFYIVAPIFIVKLLFFSSFSQSLHKISDNSLTTLEKSFLILLIGINIIFALVMTLNSYGDLARGKR